MFISELLDKPSDFYSGSGCSESTFLFFLKNGMGMSRIKYVGSHLAVS